MRVNGVEKQVRPSRVPAWYTLLQYIETTATSGTNWQILQTWINLSSNYVQFDFKFRPLALRNSDNFFFASDRANLTYEYNNWYQLFNIASSSSLFKTSMSVDTDYTMNMKLNNGTMTLNNSSVSYSWSVSWHQNICFSWYYGNSAIVCSKNRRYYIKIYTWSSFDLVRDYVPMKRNSDSAAWMYDLVNNVFYTSVANWNFVAWPEA